jgi:hypothetical protein
MYRYLLAGSLLFGLGVSLAVAAPLFQLRNEARQPVAEVNPERYFQPRSGDLQGYRLETEPARLAEVARATLAYLEQHAADDPDAVQPGLLSTWGVTLEDVKQTLRFIVRIQAEDQQVGRPSRLNQEAFLNRHFRFFSWQADRAGAAQHKLQLPDSRIRLTRYLVFEAEGSPVKTAEKNCALYALPAEESDLSADQAEARRQQLIRYRYTKQQVLAGALQPHGVKPLVWVSRQGLEDALMQGSLKVRMPDGHSRMFNVHRNNGIAYDRQIRDPRQQKRYWYFREVAGIQGYGKDEKIIVQPAVTVAGDVYNLGLGKLVALSWAQGGQSHLRLAVLADTGGAFIPNLYQLDYLAGVFPDRESFRRGVQHLPEFVQASILLLRTDRH